MEISEQRIVDQRRAIVTKRLLSKHWLEEIRAQVVETFKVTNLNTEENTIQPIDENERVTHKFYKPHSRKPVAEPI
jgi:hypothetical protein